MAYWLDASIMQKDFKPESACLITNQLCVTISQSDMSVSYSCMHSCGTKRSENGLARLWLFIRLQEQCTGYLLILRYVSELAMKHAYLLSSWKKAFQQINLLLLAKCVQCVSSDLGANRSGCGRLNILAFP